MAHAVKKQAVIIIGDDKPLEVLGQDVRERVRLTVDGSSASLSFLQAYFRNGRNAEAAAECLSRAGSSLTLNGPYLCQFLEHRGFAAAWIAPAGGHEKELAAALAQDPLAVVISTTFLPFAEDIDAIARRAKTLNPRVPVIAGGIQVWKSYRHRQRLENGDITPDIAGAVSAHNYLMDLARPSPVDLLVINQRGEETLARVLAALRDGTDVRLENNVAFYRDGRWNAMPIVPEPYHEVCVDWSRFVPPDADCYVPVQAGQGCGFHCTFCDFSGLRTRRNRPVRSIVSEIGTIPSSGLRRVYFTDDNLFATRERAREMCHAILAAGLKLHWRGMLRVSIIDEEIAALMAESGCTEVLLGIESGDPDILKRMGKPMSPGQILRAVDILATHGIHTKSTFIVGFPGETERSARNTVDLLNAYPTGKPAGHRYLFFTFAVLPLARIATPAARRRYALRGYGFHWTHATMSSPEAAECLGWMQDAVRPELSPNYVLDVPDVNGLAAGRIEEIYRLRNLIARSRRGRHAAESEAVLWDKLETAFAVPPS